MTRDEYYSNLELYHHGISGMKWGKKNGPPYPLGGSDHSASEKEAGTKGWTKAAKKEISDETKSKIKTTAKVAGTVAISATAITAGAVAISKMNKLSTSAKAIKNAKRFMHNNHIKGMAYDAIAGAAYDAREGIKKGVKAGFKEGMSEGPKKATKAVGIGLSMLGMKELMDMTVGKETSAKVFKANNNKKIDSFWRVGQEDRDDKDN